MGLDSVQLVIDMEDFFGVGIPDAEAEKIRTVQDAADCIASKLKYAERNIDIKTEVFKQLIDAMSAIGVSERSILPDEKIVELLPFNDDLWHELRSRLNFKLPHPQSSSRFGQFIRKILPVNSKVEDASIGRFVDLICAMNYKALLEKGKIKNSYEVLIGVMGITIESLGVNPFDVFPDSSFVNDLGVD